MSEAVAAYRHVAASPEFRAIEKAMSKARHDEAQAIRNAELREREKWQSVVEEKDRLVEEQAKLVEEQAKLVEEKDKLVEEKDKLVEEKDKLVEEQAKLIAELQARLGEKAAK